MRANRAAIGAWRALGDRWCVDRGSAQDDHHDQVAAPHDTRRLARCGKARAWADAGKDVHVYLDNDAKVHAPFDAQRLAAMVGDVPEGTAGMEVVDEGP